MAPAKKVRGRKYAARMCKLRALRKEKMEQARELETKRQAAILLKSLSKREMVRVENSADGKLDW